MVIDEELERRFQSVEDRTTLETKLVRGVIDDAVRYLDGQISALGEEVDKEFRRVYAEFEKVDERFDAVGERFDAVDERFDGIDKRLDGVDERFDRVDKRLDRIGMRLDGADGHMVSMDAKLEVILSRLPAPEGIAHEPTWPRARLRARGQVGRSSVNRG